MIVEILCGIALIVILVTVLMGSDTGIMVGFLIVLFGIVISLVKFPGLSIILVAILIVLLIIRTIRRRLNTGPDGTVRKYKGSEAGGCLIAGLGMLLMLPGAIAIFFVLALQDLVFLAALAGLACMFIGWWVMQTGLDS